MVFDVKPNHGGSDAIDNVDHRAGIGIEQRLVIGRDGRCEIGLIEHASPRYGARRAAAEG
jgi:hypothetical protein